MAYGDIGVSEAENDFISYTLALEVVVEATETELREFWSDLEFYSDKALERTATCKKQSKHISNLGKQIVELRKSKDICPICMTWSWAPCDVGDEGAEQRGEEWTLCQCCNDSRIAMHWKGRAEKLREAGQGIRTYWYRYIADGDKRMQYGAWIQYMKSAILKLEAALGEGDGG